MIIIKIIIKSDILKVWNTWINSDDIVKWYSGHDDWYTSDASNNLQVGKSFTYMMKSKEEKNYFEFKGTYTAINKYQDICYLMEDNREVITNFQKNYNKTIITQRIETDALNSKESQALWWKTILMNFKNYAENSV